ncbi:MAG: hypothetical protein NUV97_00630 [archaeon]|nr:hypothetical protein [archaeon]
MKIKPDNQKTIIFYKKELKQQHFLINKKTKVTIMDSIKINSNVISHITNLNGLQETEILKKVGLNNAFQLGSLNSVLNFSPEVSKKYRGEIRKQVRNYLKDLNNIQLKDLSKISVFGETKTFDIFGYKLPGDKRDSTFMVLLPKVKVEKAQPKKAPAKTAAKTETPQPKPQIEGTTI